MPNNLTSNLDANINTQKAQNLLNIIQDNRSNPLYSTALQSIQGLFVQMFAAFQSFYTTLGEPTIQLNLQKVGSPAISADYNATNKQIYNDINLAYQETNALGNAIVQDFNYSEAERQMLTNAISKLNADAMDYFMYTAGATSESIFAGDNFANSSKIDQSMVAAGFTQAQISTIQGVTTLSVTGNTDLSPNVLTVTNFNSTLPPWDPPSSTGTYEGCFWALQNQMRPEGTGLTLEYASDGTTLVELGTPEAGLVPNRMKMFDDNPNTFWEIEYVTSLITGYQNTQTGAQITVAQYNALFNNDAGSSATTVIGGVVVASNTNNLSSQFTPVITSGASIPSLSINFTVEMMNPVNMNWLSLNPNNFGETDYLQVTSIKLSSDGSNFTTLPGFANGSSDTTLTNLTNQELTPDLATETLSPDQYGYAGQGLWVFDPQSVSAIQFTINQPQGYVQPYNVLMVTVTYTITTTTKTTALFGLISSTKTSNQTVNNNIAIPYLVGQVTGFNVMSLQSGSTSVNTQPDLISQVVEDVSLVSYIPIIGNIFDAVIDAIFGTTKTTQSVSPQTISNQWIVTNYDKDRFAIGIQEIGMYAYQFTTQSMLTSLPFISPLPIAMVSLEVVENIPSAFLASSFEGQQYDWIMYYISADDGTSWHQISPMSHNNEVASDGVTPIPQVINVNSAVAIADQTNKLAYISTSSPEYTIRFRAVFSRPTTIENANSYTPTLSSYQLQIYPLGGLS